MANVEAGRGARWPILVGVGASIFMFTLDMSIVNVALPTLQRHFAASVHAVQWTVLAYTTVIASLVLGAAQLADRFGRRRAYLFGLGLFTLASALAAMAPSLPLLIAARALQGLGAIFISALSIAVLTLTFPRSEHGRAIGMMGPLVLAGLALGPAVGGLVLQAFGWRAIFLINLPVGTLLFVLMLRLLPAALDARTSGGIDARGMVTSALTLAALMIALAIGQAGGFARPLPLALAATALASLVLFVRFERSAAHPMLPLALFYGRRFVILLVAGLSLFLVIAGSMSVQPFFLQQGLGLAVAQVGLLLAIGPIAAGLAQPVMGALTDRIGPDRMTLAGFAVLALGCVSILSIDLQTTPFGYGLRVLLYGIATGMVHAGNSVAVMGATSSGKAPLASALLSLTRSLGQTVGAAIAFAIIAALAASTGARGYAMTPEQAERALHVVFALNLALAVLGLVLGRLAARPDPDLNPP
ncbi:MAG: MFS transporter [Burkholderiales bacterium]|nr:MAG: MFS transporter [Burkholderiales bacterium]